MEDDSGSGSEEEIPIVANILHLSDLHYTRRDKHNHAIILDALFRDISQLSDGTLKPDVIVFSGDLVHRGDEEDAYGWFMDDVLEPILKATKCSPSRVIVTAGNHDVSRTYTESAEHLQTGLNTDLNRRDPLNEEYSRPHLRSLFEGKFKDFLALRALLSEPRALFNDFVSVIPFDELGLSFIEVNSSWMGWAGLKGIRDERKLLVPEVALVDAFNKIPAKHGVVLVTHHPTNWLSEFCETDFLRTVDGRIQAHLYGHMHEPRSQATTVQKGTYLLNQAGALYQGRDRYNGYSLVRLETSAGHAAVHFRSYSDRRREFHEGVDVTNGGIFYSTKAAEGFFYGERKLVDSVRLASWCKQVLLPTLEREFNEGLVSRPLCDIFVAPPLYTQAVFEEGEDDQVSQRVETIVSFDDVVRSDKNLVVFGNAEYGKTTLLRQLAVSRLKLGLLRGSPAVTVVISFGGISRGTDRIERLIRSSLPEFPPDFSVSQLLRQGLITLMVDDVVFSDPVRYPVLQKFVSIYPKNRFVFSANIARRERYLSTQDAKLSILLEHIYIRPLRRKDMRSLVEKWDPGQRFDRESVLNRMIAEFRNMNVPTTAVNGTILLSIYEDQSDFKPINRAVLIERFVEVLLDKLSPTEIERRNFDFRLRVHYLSHVACYMAMRNTYILDESDIIALTNDYLRNLGLAQVPRVLIDDFVAARVFAHRPDKGISFRYRAFLEYFIASGMKEKATFKDWVLEEDRYLSFLNEIQYYASIGRNDDTLLDLIGHRFEKLSEKLFSELKTIPDPRSLDAFRLPPSDANSDAILEALETQMKAPPMSDAERDEILEADIPQDVDGRQEVFRPRPEDAGSRWFTALVMYSNIVRNLELIPDPLKRKHLSAVIDGWSRLVVMSLWIVPSLAKHRRMKINGIMYNVTVPRTYNDAQTARIIYLDLPNAVSKLVWGSLGTEKLELQLTEPSLDEASEPHISTLLRQSLCMDLRIGNWWSSFSSFVSQVNGQRYLLEAALWKAYETHTLGGLTQTPGNALRGTMAGIIAALRGGSRSDQAKAKANMIQRYSKQQLVRQLALRKED